MQRTIRLWLENEPGALMRVVGILGATGSNIVTLSVAPDPWQKGVSRMTITVELEPHAHEWAVAKMNRLVQVISAIDITDESRGPRPATRHIPSGRIAEPAAADAPAYLSESREAIC